VNYVGFLENVRKDMDGADAHYRRALEADPKHANTLGNYAVFLKNVRKDMDGAKSHYRRALEADPKHANTLGNYASLVLGEGRTGEGKTLLLRALLLADPGPLRAEVLYYVLAHRLGRFEPALAQMKGIVAAGVRTGDWDFSRNIARAHQDGHPDIAMLETLAQVLGEKQPPTRLDAYPKWCAAKVTDYDPSQLGIQADQSTA
jgi:protein O-mannosyl-transferase